MSAFQIAWQAIKEDFPGMYLWQQVIWVLFLWILYPLTVAAVYYGSFAPRDREDNDRAG